MRDQLAQDGFNATLESFFADVPQYHRESLELLERPAIGFDLREQPIPIDPDGSRKDVGVPFNAYSANGTVVASVVDAGHGLEDDYRALAQGGIDVRTRIVLVRYGREFRGALARRAEAHGAKGVIFFSDPADADGSLNGIAYPNGPYRPLGSVQRGSVGEFPHLTIPTLPVSALVARRIQQAMHDRITSIPVRLHVAQTLKHSLLWNTVGVLEGTDPTHMVILGGHRDAWVSGVTDNGSGIATLLETARALGYLYRTGWRPRFSIVIVGFDGEEIGEAGSASYVRTHEGELRNGAIAYINEDECTTGQHFDAMAAAAIEETIVPLTQRLNDPNGERQKLYDRWKAQRQGIVIQTPGGGSDFESFLYDLGIPVAELGFNGPFGVYHSQFDDLRYATTQADPGFVNHRAIAQAAGILAFRLASGGIPYQFTPYVSHMRASLAQLVKGGASARDLAPVALAIGRFAEHASAVRQYGMDPNREIDAIHRLDRLYYGRNGYAAVTFPDLTTAVGSRDGAAISAAVGRAVHELDTVAAYMHR